MSLRGDEGDVAISSSVCQDENEILRFTQNDGMRM